MDAKLTLKLDKHVIEAAKKYASLHKKSLSRMIESYLKSLATQKDLHSHEEIEISPFVKSMSSGMSIPSDLDYKSEYSNHMSEKYQ